MHTCMHTYILTYMHTYIHTCMYLISSLIILRKHYNANPQHFLASFVHLYLKRERERERLTERD
jgi:hypothetical protein